MDDWKRKLRNNRYGMPHHLITECDASAMLRVAVRAGLTPLDIVQWYYQEVEPERVASIENQYFAYRQAITAAEPTLGERRRRGDVIDVMDKGKPDDYRVSARTAFQCKSELMTLVAWAGGESRVARRARSFDRTLRNLRTSNQEPLADAAQELHELIKARTPDKGHTR